MVEMADRFANAICCCISCTEQVFRGAEAYRKILFLKIMLTPQSLPVIVSHKLA
jgi:hypothetical protein